MSKHLFLFVHLVFFLLFISISAQSIASSHPKCPSFNCSNVTISYPFWRINELTTQTCGYQGFGINCSDDGVRNISTITLGNDSYYVKNINYELSSIVLIDYDVSPAVNVPVCPRVRHNIELETLPLNFSTNSVNLSFHFNCSGGCPSFTTPLPCLGNGSCVHVINSESESFDWDRLLCDPEMVTTVFQDEYIELPRLWKRELMKGFQLNWGRIDDCDKCEESDGRCGRHNTTGFVCFCSDGTTAKRDCNGA